MPARPAPTKQTFSIILAVLQQPTKHTSRKKAEKKSPRASFALAIDAVQQMVAAREQREGER
jgi:hypothetical protein